MGNVTITTPGGTRSTRRATRATKRMRIIGEEVTEIDLSGMADADRCTELTLQQNGGPIELDLQPLAHLDRLASIHLEGIGAVDLAPLRTCNGLTRLALTYRGDAPVDLTPLAGHETLETLTVTTDGATPVDLSALRDLPCLRDLTLKGGRGHLDHLTQSGRPLRKLTLTHQPIRRLDLHGLVGRSTEHLFLAHLDVHTLDLGPLAESPRLSHVSLQHLRLHDHDGPPLVLEPLRRAHALTWLSLAGTELAYLDVGPIASLEHLRYAELGAVKDLVIGAQDLPIASQALGAWRDQMAVL